MCEKEGKLPTVFSFGITTFLSKGKGNKYLDMRPITLMTVLYSTWSTLRGRQIAAALEKVLPDNLYGGRKMRSTHTAEIMSAIDLETAQNNEIELIGLADDYQKCFDTFNSDLTCDVWDAIGVPAEITNVIRTHYDRHVRSMKIHGNYGPPLATNSLVQGCALSLHKVNTLFLSLIHI